MLKLIQKILDSDNKKAGILFLAAIGSFSILSKAGKLLSHGFRLIIRPTPNLPLLYGEKSWAFVTGGSNGLGLSFSHNLASKGFNLIITGRIKENLDKAKEELEQTYHVQVEAFVMNLDYFNDSEMEKVKEIVADKDVSIYINNAGKFLIGNFHQYSLLQMNAFINTNVSATMKVSHFFVNRFLEREKKSAIIYVTTFDTGTPPVPCTTIYCGTKNFIEYFGRSLHKEYKEKIDVLVLRPFVFSTRFTSKNNYTTHWTTVHPDQVAKDAFQALGFVDSVYGGFKHTFASAFIHQIWHQLVDFKAIKNGQIITRT